MSSVNGRVDTGFASRYRHQLRAGGYVATGPKSLEKACVHTRTSPASPAEPSSPASRAGFAARRAERSVVWLLAAGSPCSLAGRR